MTNFYNKSLIEWQPTLSLCGSNKSSPLSPWQTSSLGEAFLLLVLGVRVGEGDHHHQLRKWLLWRRVEQLPAVFECHKDQSTNSI